MRESYFVESVYDVVVTREKFAISSFDELTVNALHHMQDCAT